MDFESESVFVHGLELRCSEFDREWGACGTCDTCKMRSVFATLEAKLARAREALEAIAKCEASMNGYIARSALKEIDQ